MTKFITFDNFVIGHLHLWHFAAILPEKYIIREKLKRWHLKLMTAFHLCCIGFFDLPYVYSFILMMLKAEFESKFICEFLLLTSGSVRYTLFWSRREELARLLDECRDLWSYLRNEEIIMVEPYKRMVYFYRIYYLVSAYGCLVTFTIFAYFRHFVDADGNIYRQNSLK